MRRRSSVWEATHGVHEFVTLKHRLLELLVLEFGFTAIARDASYTGDLPINVYVIHGLGDPREALTGQGYVVWDCPESLNLRHRPRRILFACKKADHDYPPVTVIARRITAPAHQAVA